MTRKSSTETLIAAMRSLASDIQSGDGVANAAIAEAADRLVEQQACIKELEQNGPVMQRGVNGAGTPWMGTMRQVLEDYKTAAATEAKLGDEARAECDQLRARVAELEQANNRVILDSSDHVPDATKMVADRQLADAVNELRDIAIKYHAAGQLRERIAGVVRELVRGG